METTNVETLAEKTLRCLGAAMTNPQASSFPEIIRLVHTLSQNRNNITVGELAALVEKDAKMLVKVLQLSNSIGYNIGKIKITTVTQAIQMVGFNCVCSIAMATMLLEQCTNQGTDEQKEASAMALCAGTLAKPQGATRHGCERGIWRDFGTIALISVNQPHFWPVTAGSRETATIWALHRTGSGDWRQHSPGIAAWGIA